MTNTFDNASTAADQLVIRVTARVANALVNQSGDTVLNTGRLEYVDGQGTDQILNSSVTIDVVEPRVTAAKVVTSATTGLDAGDEVTYQITIDNLAANGATGPAYDVSLSNLLPAGMLIKAGSISAPTLNAGASVDTALAGEGTNNLTGIFDIPLGGSVVFTFVAIIPDTVTPGQTLTSDLNVTFSSQNGVVTGERTGASVADPEDNTPPTNDAILNNYAVGVDTSVTAVNPFSVTKTLNATSVATTAGSSVTIGEILTYQLEVSVMEGTTNNISLVDTLPAGLEYIAGTAAISNANGITVNGFAANIAGQILTITATSAVNPGGSNATANDPATADTDSFFITYQVRVANVATNTSGTNLVNDVDATATGTPPDINNQVTVTVVEPRLAIDKTITSSTAGLDAGDTVTYQIEITHAAASTAAAFDLIVNDTIPADLQNVTLVSAVVTDGATTTNVAPAGTNQIQIAGSTISSTGTLDLLRDTNGVGNHQKLVITVSGVVKNDTNVGKLISNTATVLWSSLDGGLDGDDAGTNNERTGAGANPPNNYTASDTVNVNTRGILNVTKAAATATATIGDEVTYIVTFEVAQGRTVINWADTLPAGMSLVPNSVALSANPDALNIVGLNDNTLVGQVLTVTSTGTPSNDPAVLETSTFTITYQARVLDVASNDGLTAAADGTGQTSLVNSLNASADLNNDGDTNDAGERDENNTATVTVIEPRVVVTKTNNDADGVVVPGQEVTYTIVVSNLAANGSTATAYDVSVRDVIPSGMTYVAGSISNTAGKAPTSFTEAGGTITALFDSLALGETSTLTFKVTVNTTAVANTIFDNNVRIHYDTQPADDDNTLDPGDPNVPADGPDRDYGPNPGVEVHNLDTDPHQDTDRLTVGAFTLGDFVWFDVNADGVQDAGEQGIKDVTITLLYAGNDGIFGNADDVTFTTTTDVNGAYLFSNLANGNYRATVNTATLPDGAASVQTFDADGLGTANTAQFTLTGANIVTADFGYRGTGSIGDLVWLDSDGSATVNGLEKGIPGVTLNLIWDENGNGVVDAGEGVIATLTTGANGQYDFTNLFAGRYFVDVTDTGNVLANATLTGVAGITDPFLVTLAVAQDFNDADFGYRGSAAIGDFVWMDLNGDGVQDGTEPGIAGVTVNLFRDVNNNGLVDIGDVQIATTTTSAAGAYAFTGLIAGNYLVQVDTTSAALAGGTNTFDKDDNAGSANNDSQSSVQLGATEIDNGVDFGYRGNAQLGNYVWFDFNGDGIQDATEPPLAGVRVFLDLNNNGIYDAATDPAAITAADGSYSFTGLLPRNYDVRIDTSTLPTSATGTFVFDDPDVAGIPLATGHLSTVALSAAETENRVDYGYRGTFSVSGVSYHDRTKNNTFDGSDTGIGGVTIELIWDTNNDGAFDAGDFILSSVITAADGSYSFANLLAGNYLVRETQPVGFGNSQNGTNLIDVTVTNANVTNQNFGNTTGSLAGTVYRDDNNNAAQDAGEPGIQGQTVTLLWSGADGIFGNADDKTVTTMTDVNGNYIFDHTNTDGFLTGFGNTTRGLSSVGLYRIIETQPAGFLDGADTVGNAAVATGTVTGASGGRDGSDTLNNIQIAAGQDATGYLFGELTPASISGFVYLDLDNDGVKDPTESGLVGVTITLTGTNDLGAAVNLNTVTGADGSYSFTGLRPGTYAVTETQPAAYLDGADTAGTGFAPAAGNNNGTAGADTITGIVIANVAPANNTGINYNFGEQFNPNSVKTLKATDQAHTAGSDVVIGETITYRLVFDVPFGTVNDVIVRDLLPDGLRFLNDGTAKVALVSSDGTKLTSSILAAGAQATGPAAGVNPAFVLPDASVSSAPSSNVDVYVSGTDVYFRLGNLTNSEAASAPAQVVIEFNAIVVNDVANQATTVRGNQFTVAWDRNGNNSGADEPTDIAGTSNTVNATIVEPVLTVAKSVNDDTPHLGQTIQYTVDVFNQDTATGTTAHNVRIVDAIPANKLTALNNIVVTRLDMQGTTATGDDTVIATLTAGTDYTITASTTGYTITIASIAEDERIRITYDATVTTNTLDALGADRVFGGVGADSDAFTNIVAVDWSSVPGTTADERTGADGVGGALNDYAVGTSQSVTVVGADLKVTKTDGGANATPGGIVTYTVVVTNQGTDTANSVVVTDTLPTSGISYTAGSATATAAFTENTATAGKIIWNLTNPLAAGASVTFTVPINISNPAPANLELLTNLVEVDYDEATSGEDPTDEAADVRDDNDATDTTPLVAAPIITVTKDDGLVNVAPGDALTYTIVVRNTGNQNAIVDILDDFPEQNLTLIAASDANGVVMTPIGANDQLFWDDVVLNAGATITITVQAIVTDPQPIIVNQFTNAVTVTDTNPTAPVPPVTTSDINQLVAFPDLMVVKTSDAQVVRPDEKLTYTITVTNIGNRNATGVEVEDFLPAGVEYVSSTGGANQGLYDPGTHTVKWTFADPFIGANNQTEVLTVEVKVKSDFRLGDLVNKVEVKNDGTNGPEISLSNNESSFSIRVLGFGFDSSNNFHTFRLFSAFDLDDDDFYRLRPIDNYRDPMLTLAPIYSGEAEPGSTLVIILYNAKGEVIGRQTVVVDTGGNWMASFPGSIVRDYPQSVHISQTPSSNNHDPEHGYNLRPYYATALHSGHFFQEDLSVNRVLTGSASVVTGALFSSLNNPLGFELGKHSYEHISIPGHPTGR
ncbi:MAG: beta strand repeat-containing protein [Candidatus Methylacidiphilales bacterium]